MNNNPCPQCPWRTANQGKRHFGSFYTKTNLTRLWNQIRKGGAPQGCHLTDPSHPDHIQAGCAEDSTARECPASVILVLREMDTMCKLGETPGLIDVQAVEAYLSKRRRGLTRNGIAYWALARWKFGGTILGEQKLPKVDREDPDIDLPAYLKT